jgi:hypothetical protein
VWPDFSLLNHSCAPTASYMALGEAPHMVVRAAKQILSGEEVSGSFGSSGDSFWILMLLQRVMLNFIQ